MRYSTCVFVASAAMVPSLVLCTAAADAATGTKTCSIEASGGACLFDITANAGGSLSVCSTAGTTGARWRATIVQVNTAGAVSAVGTGATGTCSGSISKPVVAGGKYIVEITYDGPLSGTYPKTAAVTISGPFAAIPNPRPCYPGDQVSACSADPQIIACGADISCDLTEGDVDVYKFDAPANGAVAIKVCGASGARWDLYSPTGERISYDYGFSVSPLLTVAGRYSVSVSNVYATRHAYSLSLQGITQAYQCAISIADGQQRSSSFSTCSDLDAFSFVASAGQVYNIRISGCSGSRWDLFDPVGRRLDYDYGSSTTPVLITPGMHTIIASNVYGTTCPYSITLNRVTATAETQE